MGMRATIGADFTQVHQAVANLKVNLEGLGVSAGTLQKQFNRLLDSFSGRAIAREADQVAKAVEALGGASKLTAAEQARVNRVMSEAAEKYRALGKEVPTHISQLATATQHTEKLDGSFKSLIKSMGGFSGILGAFGVTMGAGAFVAAARGAMEYADRLDELATGAGVSVEALQELGFAAQQNGADLQTMTNTLLNLAERIGSADDKTVAAIEGMGLSFKEVRQLAPDQMFMAVAQALRDVEDPAKRNALAMDAIGKSWKAMMPTILSDIEEFRAKAPKMTEETVKALGTLNDTWAAWKLSLSVGLGKEIAQTEQDFNKLKRLIEGVWNTMTFGEARSYFGTGQLPAIPGAPKGWGKGQTLGTPQLPGEAEEKELERRVAEHIEATKKAAQEAIEAQANITRAIKDWADAYDTLGKAAQRAAYAMLITADASRLAIVPTNWQYGTTFQKGVSAVGMNPPSAAGGTGGMFGTKEGTPWSWASLFGHGGIGSQIGANVTSAILGGGSVAGAIGGSLGSLIPGIGGITGPLFGWIGSKLGSLFGPSKTQQAGRQADVQSDQIKAQLIAQYGSLEKIRTLGNGAGEALYQAFGRRGVDGLTLVNQALATFKTNLDLQNQIDSLNAQLTGLKDQLVPTWDQVNAVAQKYGLTLDALGLKAQQLYTTDAAKKLLEDFQLLERAGADNATVAAAMGKELNQLVQDSVKYGTELPGNMKPVLQYLIDQGLLTDEAGTKLKDLGGLKFGEDVVTEADKINLAIQKLVEQIQALVDKLNGLDGKTVNANVNVNYGTNEHGQPKNRDGSDNPDYAALGGYVTRRGVQYLAGGGVLLPFVPRGSDTVPAMLTPGEGVLSRRGMAALGALNRGGGLGGGVVVQAGAIVLNNPVLNDRRAVDMLADAMATGLMQKWQQRRRAV